MGNGERIELILVYGDRFIEAFSDLSIQIDLDMGKHGNHNNPR
jgi:hypothetical protein